MKRRTSAENINFQIDNTIFFRHQSKRKLKDDYIIGKVVGKGKSL